MLVFYTRKTEIEAPEAEGQELVVDAHLAQDGDLLRDKARVMRLLLQGLIQLRQRALQIKPALLRLDRVDPLSDGRLPMQGDDPSPPRPLSGGCLSIADVD